MEIKAVLRNGLLVVASVTISFAAGEFVLSLLNKPPLFRYYTRALEEVQAGAWADWWVYKPGRGVYFDPIALTKTRRASLRSVSPNWARLETLNSAGFHDADEFDLDVAEWNYRLLFVGDSFTWGASADIAHSFVEVVESRLKSRDSRSLIWNAAIPATGTAQAAISVRELLPEMQPHVVVLGLFENDLTDNLYPLDRLLRTASGVAISQYRWDKQLQTPVKERMEHIQSNLQLQIQRSEPGIYGMSRIANLLGTLWHDKRENSRRVLPEHKLAPTRFYLNQIKEHCQAQQIDLLVLLIPSRRSASNTSTAEYEALETILHSEDVRFVSIRERLRPQHYASLPDNHWNNQGHLIAAIALLEILDEL